LDRDRQSTTLSVDPQAREDRRIGLPLQLCATRTPGHTNGPGQGSLPALAGGGRVRVRQRPLWTRPLPSPPLHVTPAAHRAHPGRARGLRRHRRPSQTPCASTDPAHHTRPTTTRRPRPDRTHRRRNQTPVPAGHPPPPARNPPPALGLVATTPPSPRPLVPPPRTTTP